MERVAGIEPASSAWKAEVIAIIPYPLEMVVGGGFEPPKLARQIYSLIPLATREPLPQEPERADFPGSFTQERHFMGIEVLVQSFHSVFRIK